MIHFPAVETLQSKRSWGLYQKEKRLIKEKKKHKQNCYKAQKVKLDLMELYND